MRLVFYIVSFLLLSQLAIGQSHLDTTGDWDVSTNWDTGIVPSGTGSDVIFDTNINLTGLGFSSYSIGNVTGTGPNNIIINVGRSLTLGSMTLYNGGMGTNKDLTLGNATNVSVQGLLEVWGDLIVGTGVDITITGSFIVHGDITIQDNGDLNLLGSASLIVDGDFTGGANTDLSTVGGGSIDIGGDLTLGGGGSQIIGPNGTVHVHGSCTIGGAVCPGSTVPIELIFFEGETKYSIVKLTWGTALEENFDHFEIERATEGGEFEYIGEIKGSGESKFRQDYSFTDKYPEIGYNYYRLKSVDIDGGYSYSEIALVDFTSDLQLEISPNPSNGIIHVKTSQVSGRGLEYKVINQKGKIVYAGTLKEFNTTVNLNSLPKGLYLFYAVGVPSVGTQRFLLK